MSTNKPYHHTPNRRFRNPQGSPSETAGFRDFLKFARSQAKRTPFAIPEDHVLSVEQAKAGWEQHKDTDCLLWLGHAAFLMRMQGKTILIDPYLSEYASPFPYLGPKRFARPGLPVHALPPIDIILQTHAHYDHLDKVTLKAIPAKDKIQVITTLGVGRYFRAWGFSQIEELDWHQSHNAHGIEFTALPAIHFSRRWLFDKNKALWAGFSLKTPAQHIYFSGDTAHGEVFAQVGEQYGPFDLSIVGIGAYEPQAIMRPVHANPEEGIQIAQDVVSKNILAMHWGTIVLSAEPPFEPPTRFLEAGRKAGYADENLWVMKIGETRPLPQESA